jgi:RimJ/RimL family protein N-acetyltransferase
VQSIPSQTFTRAELSIRPAQPADRAALEAIAGQTWDGNDYLPRVLDDWFSDPHDGFYVAVLRRQVIGVAKVTRFAEGEWWLEGLRIDPAFQGHGIARVLHHFMMNQVRKMGSGVVRFSTASMNEAVKQLAKETGFELMATYLPYGADALDEPVQSVWQLGPDDTPRVWAWLDESEHFVRARRSVEWDWSYYLLTETRLAEQVAAGLVYGWPSAGRRDQLGGVIAVTPVEKARWLGDPTLKIAYLDAGDLAAAARDMRRLAAALGRARVRIKVLNRPERVTALEAAGYTREWDGEAWLYARDVSLTAHADVRTENAPPSENY